MSKGIPLVRIWMDFMNEMGWIEVTLFLLGAKFSTYHKPRTSFDDGLWLICNKFTRGVLLLDDVEVPIQLLLASIDPCLPTCDRLFQEELKCPFVHLKENPWPNPIQMEWEAFILDPWFWYSDFRCGVLNLRRST